jgi:inorganic pyrophosphatase
VFWQRVRPIGVLNMTDEQGVDLKLLAVAGSELGLAVACSIYSVTVH